MLVFKLNFLENEALNEEILFYIFHLFFFLRGIIPYVTEHPV